MNYRLNSGAMIALGAVVLLALGLFGFTYFMGSGARTPIASDEATSTDPIIPIRRIEALHQFKDGVHTIAGELEVPTPCHVLSTDASMRNGQSNDILVEFTATTEAEVCAQVITQARFKESFEAPENAIINATYNGEPVTLNLVPAPADQPLDQFEEYFKG